MSLFRKFTLSSSPSAIEETAKDVIIRSTLTIELGRAIRVLHQENVNKDKAIQGGEGLIGLCSCLEAIFLHGLKGNLVNRVTSVFTNTSDKLPEIDFWEALTMYCHKDVLKHLKSQSQLKTPVGRCRAWLRLALNEGLLPNYVEAMLQDKENLQNYYRFTAYLRDNEQPDIMKQLLEGLACQTFQIAYNCSFLNVWNPEPLILAGICTPLNAPVPIMPASDCNDFFNFEKAKPVTPQGSRRVLKSDDFKPSDLAEISIPVPTPSTSETKPKEMVTSNIESQCEILDLPKPTASSSPKESEFLADAEVVSEISSESIRDTQSFENVEVMQENPEGRSNLEDILSSLVNESISSNNLLRKRCWSYSTEDENLDPNCIYSQSYDSILKGYKIEQAMIEDPESTEETDVDPVAGPSQEKEAMEVPQEDDEASPDTSEFEVVPKVLALTSENADECTQKLISIIGTICHEKGLDTQDYKCNSCGRLIGMIYGKSYVCNYDGYNYCIECYGEEESIIPARILFNWDFSKYPVAKHIKTFLQRVEDEPLIDVSKSNSQLYTIIDEVAEIKSLRLQLSFLRSYLFTCKESIAEQLRKRVWPREHLYEHVNLYSISDFLQVQSGTLAQKLMKDINFAKKHVFSCHLCSMKGFVCEVCNNPKVIYPFETVSTYQCSECQAVFHNTCMDKQKPCPKCERKRKRDLDPDFGWSVSKPDDFL